MIHEKRKIKFGIKQASVEIENSRWQCKTCDRPTETPDSEYCIHCRMYWEDVSNGLFNFGDDYG